MKPDIKLNINEVKYEDYAQIKDLTREQNKKDYDEFILTTDYMIKEIKTKGKKNWLNRI